MSSDLKDYYDSLDRLMQKRSKILPRGSGITFDNVALEAGRAKGSIKANRPVYQKLRIDILRAKESQNSSELGNDNKIKGLKAEVEKYKLLYEDAIKREISLYCQLWDMKDRLVAENEAIDKHKLIPIFRKKSGENLSDRSN